MPQLELLSSTRKPYGCRVKQKPLKSNDEQDVLAKSQGCKHVHGAGPRPGVQGSNRSRESVARYRRGTVMSWINAWCH